MKRRSITTIVFIFLLAGLAIAGDKLTGTQGAVPNSSPEASLSPLVQGSENRAVSCLLLSNHAGDLTGTKSLFEANMTGITFDIFDISTGAPSVVFLEGFDCVLLMENSLSTYGPDVGAVIYDYVVNSMGSVLYATFIWQNWTTWGGYGWGAMEGICPMYETGGCAYTPDSLDMGSVVSHPVTDGITSLSIDSGYRGGTSLSSSATGLGNWAGDGTPAIAVDESFGGRQCAICVFPANELWGSHSGDFYLLFENAINWCASGGGVLYPSLDIRCNGETSNVEIYQGNAAVVTVDIQARDFLGFPVEIWVAIKTPAGNWYTFQTGNWFAGLSHPAYQGGLFDVSGTVLNMVLPVGMYEAYVALDLYQNGLVDFPLFDFDMVDFEVVIPPTEYKWDSGSTNNLLCWTSGGDMVGMHCFDTIPGGEMLTNVGTIFGSVMYSNYAPGNGTPTEFYVWEATSFGDPTNATLLALGTGVVGNVDTDVHYWDACPCTVTTPNFYVAYNLHHAGYEYCLAIDSTNPYVYGAAFYTGTNTMYGFDPYNLYGNQYPPSESPYGFWTVRAEY